MRKEIKLTSEKDVKALADIAAKVQRADKLITVCRNSVQLNALSILGVLSLVGKDNVFLVFSDNISPSLLEKPLRKAGLTV